MSSGDASKVWGLLKDRQGAEALQSFRSKLPERYQKLLEQYYKGLSRKSAPANGASSSSESR